MATRLMNPQSLPKLKVSKLKKLGKKSKSEDIRQSLFELLNLRPWSEEDRLLYNDEDVQTAIEHDPNAVKERYDFEKFNNTYPLLQAICLGASWETLEMMVDIYPEAVMVRDIYDGTFLHTVCGNDYTNTVSSDAISLLMERYPGAVEEKNAKGNTVLHLACANNADFAVIRLLVSKYNKALVSKNNKANTPLHESCASGAPLKVVRLLLEKNPGALWVENCNGRTPLMAAEHWHASEEVIQLLEKFSAPSGAGSPLQR